MTGDMTIQQGEEDLDLTRRLSEIQSPPAQVPGYEIERFLGAGAFGEVWVATERNTNRKVAIKFYNHSRGDWSQLTREVEKLAFLSSDRYVVQLIEVGWNADPPFYIMEYLEHGSLEDRLRDGPLPAHLAVEMFREVAIALVHAHGKGVLHCDLKPANVLLDQDRRPRLADFGQSRLSHEQTPALGTLYYMAPEQADLKAVPDAKWDVYALGALLFRMLTGHPPHRAPTNTVGLEKTGTLEQRLSQYRRMIRDLPSPTEHRKVRGVDRSLVEIIDRCLAHSPHKRYPNAQAVIDALNLRAIRRARRPLLIMGAIGPAVLLLVTTLLAWSAFHTVTSNTEAALTKRALESNRFAARFVAETTARDIDRRWRVLEAAAIDVRPLLLEAVGKPIGSPEQQAVMKWIVRNHTQQNETTPATSWTLTEASGRQIARSPDSDTIGRYWGFRDYFHGQGADLPPTAMNVKPLSKVHRSAVYTSGASFNRTVGFTVPIYGDENSAGEREVIGVLGMSVEIGDFGELRSAGPNTQAAVLVDTTRTFKDKLGLILQHPYLEQLRKAHGDKPLPVSYLPPYQLDRINAIRAGAKETLSEHDVDETLDSDYKDPLARDNPAYAGRWLAAIEPVIVRGRPENVKDTGWVAIVQERYSSATGPVLVLRDQLLRLGLIAVALIAAVLTGMWIFVIRLLNDSSKHGILGTIRSRAGLASESGSTGSGATGSSVSGSGTGLSSRSGLSGSGELGSSVIGAGVASASSPVTSTHASANEPPTEDLAAPRVREPAPSILSRPQIDEHPRLD